MEDSGKDNGALQRQLAELRKKVSDLEAAEKVWERTEQALKEERDFNATVLNTVDALVNVLGAANTQKYSGAGPRRPLGNAP